MKNDLTYMICLLKNEDKYLEIETNLKKNTFEI